MNKELKEISKHMLGLGLGSLAHANLHSHLYSFENHWWAELSVIQAAHAAEIIIKAKIAEEHPLLIFEQLPRLNKQEIGPLEIKHLFEKGRTVQYADLPDRLWAATGLTLKNIEQFRSFGKLRNTIQHFAPPKDVDFGSQTIEFIYGVIDPFIHDCWGLYAIDYNEDHEPYEYLIPILMEQEIEFHVSPDSSEVLKYLEIDWSNRAPEYKNTMQRRFEEAKNLLKHS